MAYTDDYVKTNWVNYPSTNTPLNQTNLNHAEGGIKTNCGRIANLDTTKANQSDLLLTVKNVAFDSTTGTFTFTLWNNTTITVNTDIEKVAVNFTYDDDPTSPHYQNLVLELSDGTCKYIDMSALITQYEFTNTSTIAFTVSAGGEITANVVDGSITANKLQPNYLADCQAAQTGAQNAKAAADADALKAEGFANGTQNGTPVTSGPYYENNAKYWKEQAQAIASQSLAGLTDVDINAPADGDILVYDSADNEWKNQGNHAVTVTNNPISITTQSAQVARDTKITLLPIQASGTPTPSNPLPISGYDSVEVKVTGKNVLPLNLATLKALNTTGTWSGNVYTLNSLTITVDMDSNGLITGIKVNGTASARTDFSLYSLNPSTFSGYVLNGGVRSGKDVNYEQTNGIVRVSTTGNDVTIPNTFTQMTGVCYIRISNGSVCSNDMFYPMIRVASEADNTFAPYTPATQITHSFPTTIYGGEVDVERGVLTVKFVKETLTWGNGTNKTNLGTVTRATFTLTNYAREGVTVPNKCSVAPKNINYSSDTTHFYVENNQKQVWVFLPNGTGNDTQFDLAYELATPYEIPLTPRLVNLLQGANVITSNGTSVTLTYREGTIATLEEVNILSEKIFDAVNNADRFDGVYGFIEHNAILDPVQRIEYIGLNKDYSPIHVGMGGGYTLGDWLNFPLLVENKPCMVKSDGTLDYELDENDYTKKKADGTASDVANTSYDGGAFAWIKKIYKQEYMDGTDRYVLFSFTEKVGFEPVGFVDTEGNVLDGVWIPMFYGALNGTKLTSLSGTQPDYGKTTAQQKTAIDNFSSRAKFFGGSIIETLTDVMIMLGHSTNTQAVYGYGNCDGYDASLAPTNGVKANAVVNGGQFYGTSDEKSLNKVFHSLVLASWQQYQRDPYTISVSGILKVSKNYAYDVTGATYDATSLNYANVGDANWHYPDTYKTVKGFGSIPQDAPPFNGSSVLGGCDGVIVNASITAVALRFGGCNNGTRGGVRALDLATTANGTTWVIGASVLLLPPVNHDPTKANLDTIATIEDGTTASQAYKVNEYFIRGGKLCKCISAISAGSAFTLNTNYKETTLANEIPKYTVSTTDITAGTTPLASGQFYIYRS